MMYRVLFYQILKTSCRERRENSVPTTWSGKESYPELLTRTKSTVEVKSIVAHSRTH